MILENSVNLNPNFTLPSCSCVCPGWLSRSSGRKAVPTLSNRWSAWQVVLDSCSPRTQTDRSASDGAEAVAGAAVTVLTMMQAMGLMATVHPVVPLLHMCCLQRRFVSLCLDARRHKRRLFWPGSLTVRSPDMGQTFDGEN